MYVHSAKYASTHAIFANPNGPKIECGTMDPSHTQQTVDDGDVAEVVL